jgi:hypothetical protein
MGCGRSPALEEVHSLRAARPDLADLPVDDMAQEIVESELRKRKADQAKGRQLPRAPL